jgi:alpha-galactosidase
MQENYVLVGAGSAMFTRGLVADLINAGQPCNLSLIDTDPDALSVAERLAGKMIASVGAPITLWVDTDRRALLSDATAVICTIGVGGRRAWEQDVFIPRRFGIYQPVGDSVMPGGTSRALRMIPDMIEIAKDVLDLAPQALFFNYGNPMGPVCHAVRKATGANMIGLCHGVLHTAQYLANVLQVPPESLQYRAVGMNHLTWFLEVTVDNEDAMPRLQEIGRAGCDSDNPFSWQLLELFNAFPAVLDRHVTEFFPQLFTEKGSYYGKTLGVDAFSLEDTITLGDNIFAEMRAVADARGPLPDDYLNSIGGEHEQVIDIIASIRNNQQHIYSANLPNTGQVPNLPPNSIIECPAVSSAAGLHALFQHPLPSGLVGTLATRLAWVETVVEAALEGSRQKFIQALLLDGSVKSLVMAAELADNLLAAHQVHLPQFFRSHEDISITIEEINNLEA